VRRRRERNVSKLAELPQVLSKLIAARFKASRLLEVGLASEAGPTFPSIGPIAVPFARTLQGSLHSGENPGNYSPARCLLTGYGDCHYTPGLELRNRRLPLHRVFKTPTFSKSDGRSSGGDDERPSSDTEEFCAAGGHGTGLQRIAAMRRKTQDFGLS